MNKLKLLQLKYVKLTGSYEDFPDLRWLCWHGFPLHTMPPGLLKSSLVAIDMSYGHIETFEAPTVLDSLKILNLQECDKLVSIQKLYRFPKLETLILAHCRNLTHLSDSIGDLKSLALLNLKGCIKLSKASNVISSRIDGGNVVQPLFCLPSSLKFLYLNYCQIEYKNDVRVSFQAQSFFDLCLERNPFKSLPTSIDLKMLKTLNLYACFLLKSLPCIPSTLEELYIDRCSSLKKISFKSGRFNLQQFSYKDCFELSEVQGLFKLLPVAQIDEADLVQHMQWIKEYEDRRMYLVGDEITNGRFRPIQMLYEYGIMSTYLQGINDQIMMTSEYTSSFGFLSFCVPFHHKENRIKGLYVSCLYRSSGSNGIDRSCLWVKISNKSKGLTWVYNPVVYSKPCINEDVLWLSYWPIGNTLDVGDVVHVEIIVDEGVMTVSECGASVVYIDDEEEEEENYKSNTMKREEVIGGDLTEFEVTTGGYYLCRRDLFGSETSSWLNWWFDLDIHYPELQGWKKTRQLTMRTSISDMMRYDIFLSFRGKDTRHSFTDHLYHALIRAGLYTFRDDDAIPRGQVLKPEIETAIKESRVFIVVLSKNYANSRWCMDELCLILEQRRHYNRFVLPVFYHVDPSDVGNQTGSFAIEGSKRTEDKVRWWKEALTEVATLKGMVLSGSRSEAGLIKKVVDTIYYKV